MEKTFEEKFGLKAEELEKILGGVYQSIGLDNEQEASSCEGGCMIACNTCVGCSSECMGCKGLFAIA